MMNTENIYQSILLKIGNMPADYLQLVDDYLQKLNQKIEEKKNDNRNEIMQLAGSWNDMSDNDFNEYLDIAKDTGNSIFQDRDITL